MVKQRLDGLVLLDWETLLLMTKSLLSGPSSAHTSVQAEKSFWSFRAAGRTSGVRPSGR